MATIVEAQSASTINYEATETKYDATESDWSHLRRIPDKFPKIALLILAVEVSQFLFDSLIY